MNDHDHATVTAMEQSDRESVRLFAHVYTASTDHARTAMRRDAVWEEYAAKEESKEEPCEQGYRWIKPGEILEIGDEFKHPDMAAFEPTINAGMMVSDDNYLKYRRRIIPESPSSPYQTELEKLREINETLLDAVKALGECFHIATGTPSLVAATAIAKATAK